MYAIARSNATALLLGLALGFSGLDSAASPGALDPTDNGTGLARHPFGPATDLASAAVLQLDGRLLVAGTTSNGSSADWCVRRYRIDDPNPRPTLRRLKRATSPGQRKCRT